MRAVVAGCELALPTRLSEQFLDHQRVDVDHVVLNQVQRKHAGFAAVAGHLAATGKEYEIRGAVPLFNDV